MSEIKMRISKKVFNDIYYPYLSNYNSRVNVFYGGAGSGKSHFVVQKIVYKCLKFENRRCLVIRKFGTTLRDSIFALFKSVLSDWKIIDDVDVKESLLTITFPNGSTIIFKGMDDSEKIKSISNIDDIIIEEATELTIEEFSQLNLRLRSRNKYNQIHLMYNPVSKNNWVYNCFHNRIQDDNVLIVHTTYLDNKFLPEDYVSSIKQLENTNPTYYKIYVLGEFATLDKLVFNKYEVCNFDIQNLKFNTDFKKFFGLDFGYSNDNTAFVAVAVNQDTKEMFIFDEHVSRGLTNDEIAKIIKDSGYSKEIIFADSSEPKSIEEIRRNGVPRIKPAKKGKDSILNGLQFLQQYSIKIHPNCINTYTEFANYSWKKDKNGNYINQPIDTFNHCIDALRYAVSDFNKVGLRFFKRLK